MSTESRVLSSPLARKIAGVEGIDLGNVTGTGWGGRIVEKDVRDALAKGPVAPSPAKSGRVIASPLAKRTARLKGVDLARVAGTGWQGRIVEKDVLSAKPGAAPPAAMVIPPGGRVEPMSSMRMKIAEHMVRSRRTSAHVTTVFEVDMSEVVKFRDREKNAFLAANNVKLTFTPFIALAAVQALQEFPFMNASVDGNNVVYHDHVNLSVAVSVPEGLIVPVIKNADGKDLAGIAKAIQELAEKARARKLTLPEMQGGTFTLSNPGNQGALFATPIINQPQVAILGVGTIQKRAVVINDMIAIRSMCYIDLSFDHRLVDGVEADRYMARVKEKLETWNQPTK